MEKTMTIPMNGFMEMAENETMKVDGGTDWNKYWAGMFGAVGCGVLGVICPVAAPACCAAGISCALFAASNS